MAFDKVTEKALKDIAKNLNVRGFVIDADITLPFSYTQFSEFVVSKVRALRNRGYKGGALKRWNTQFRPGYSSYGAVDSSQKISDEIIFESCDLKESTFEATTLPIDRLEFFRLGILFKCDNCGHEKVVAPSKLKSGIISNSKEITGKCTKCQNSKVQPSELVTY